MDYNIIDIKEHLDFLTRICLDREVSSILELGVRTGNSTRAFLRAAKVLDAKVISIDTDDCSKVANCDNWEFHQMDSLDYELKEPVDILFIDTSHTYEQTLKELLKFAPMTKQVIILHDTVSCPPVMQAIQEFLRNPDKKYKFENRTNNNGLGILWTQR